MHNRICSYLGSDCNFYATHDYCTGKYGGSAFKGWVVVIRISSECNVLV